jgi:hypothetical protein
MGGSVPGLGPVSVRYVLLTVSSHGHLRVSGVNTGFMDGD